MTTTPTKLQTTLPVTLLVGLGLVGALAGCTAPTATATDSSTDSTTETETDTGTETEAETETETDAGSESGFADGTYSALGEYQAPSGTESVEVTVTLEGGVVTAVTAVGDASDAQARGYQEQFSAGIGAIVVGQSIESLQVDKVGGASLTGAGFNAAIATIKADAAA